MNLKQLKPKLNFIKKIKTCRPILTMVKVTKNSLEVNDLETYVTIKDNHGLSEGLHYYDTLGLVASEGAVDINEYPLPPVGTHQDVILVSLSDLEHTLKYASKDETRLYLNGVAINGGYMVATDGHTLNRVKLEKETSRNYIMPRNSLTVLIKLLKGYKFTGLIRIEFNDSHALVENAQFKVSMRLIERDYPKWQAIIPTKGFLNEVDVSEMPDFKDFKLLLNKRSNACIIKASEGYVYLVPKLHPDNSYVIGAYTGDDFELGFNFNYLVRAAKKDKAFKIKFNNLLSPCEVNGSIVMPLKL